MLLSTVALVALSPVLLVAGLGIRLASPGPILYRAIRVGGHGTRFTMFKFRTMHERLEDCGASITAQADPRVFAFGSALRASKIDELPQLVNIVRGEMSIVGPRPEAPELVERYYTREHIRTLDVLPGLTSPGSIFYYTHGERLLTGDDIEKSYGESVLPMKLALDLEYIEHASLGYDLKVIGRTIKVIVLQLLGKTGFPYPPETRTGCVPGAPAAGGERAATAGSVSAPLDVRCIDPGAE